VPDYDRSPHRYQGVVVAEERLSVSFSSCNCRSSSEIKPTPGKANQQNLQSRKYDPLVQKKPAKDLIEH
jgi:hypothetical protein